jgi:hypothetical protein
MEELTIIDLFIQQLLGNNILYLIVILYGLGFFIKNNTKINNLYIPWIVLLAGVIGGYLLYGMTLIGVKNGIVVGLLTVLFDSYIGKAITNALKITTKKE